MPTAETQVKESNYSRYMAAPVNHPSSYPTVQSPDPRWYRSVAAWVGRIILPSQEERQKVMGALLEVYQAPEAYSHLIGKTVWLRWKQDPITNTRFWGVTQQVIFNEESEQFVADGFVLPTRVDNWALVNPLESIAGSHPYDDIIVRLPEPVTVEETQPNDGENNGQDDSQVILFVPHEPVQTTGRFYALVRFEGPAEGGNDLYRVVHYDTKAGEFTGLTEDVRLPTVVDNMDTVNPSMNKGIEQSPGNDLGWYVYGAQDKEGVFVVQAIAPREFVRVAPQKTLVGLKEAEQYLKPKTWISTADKGTFSSTLLCQDGADPAATLAQWQVGDTALLIHLYGGIGGNKKEKYASGPLYWGHFAFGTATIIQEPFADEPVFDIVYRQVYVQNPDGLTAGALHWTRYAGDRQFGWLGTRPLQEILVKLDCFTDQYDFGTIQRSAVEQMINHLEVMTARYRIADGRGGIRVTAANNCAQDSNQALYAAIKEIDHTLRGRADIQMWREQNVEEAARLDRLLNLGDDLRRALLPMGTARADWEWGAATLGSSLSQRPLKNISTALRSWRTLFPSITVRTLAKVFLRAGATLWVLRTNQVGGHDPDIEPIIPNM